jgi:pimeloyl-ACP methyl ester carboxylesterase
MTKQTSTSSIRLETKPSVPVNYTFMPGTETSTNGKQLLIVFLSGLRDPMKVWNGTLKQISRLRQSKKCPPILTYDRFGSGRTGRDPSDIGKDANEWHDVHDAAQDLRQLIWQVTKMEMAISDMDKIWPVFVAHSMGAAVAQLYAKTFPGEVASFLLLDATPTDTDGTSWYPDPDAPDFDATTLPIGVKAEMLRDGRNKHRASPYNPNTINAEGLRWNNVQDHLPVVGAPKFIGPAKGTPLVTIVMHDAQAYAKQLTKVCVAQHLFVHCRLGV